MRERILKNWYVIQTKCGDEEKVKNKIEKSNFDKIEIFFPKRKLWIRRKGKFVYQIKPLFPGYFFINREMDILFFKELKKIDALIRILGNKNGPQQVPIKEMKFIFSLVNEEDIITPFEAFFVDDKIKIVGGPLSGIETKIISVDKRKKRIKVKIPIFNTKKEVYLSYDLIEKVSP